MICRFCRAPVSQTFVDLGTSPLANAYVSTKQLQEREVFYPLHARVCTNCWLVQLPAFDRPSNIFDDEYAYFASYSGSWLHHCSQYTNAVVDRFGLNAGSQVIEVASNDGYLLQFFREKGIPVLGIDPAGNVADEAISKGIPTWKEFFGTDVAKKVAYEGSRADLLIGNNVLAHVPDLNDFVSGLKIALAPEGVITMEFPHLLQLIDKNEFDTIYHEHFSYFSFLTVTSIFEHHQIPIFDADELGTHGGSLRIYAHHADDTTHSANGRKIQEILEKEYRYGLTELSTYKAFSQQVKASKRRILRFLIDAKDAGKSVVGYAAAAKGNTLFNYCGVRSDFLDYVVDRSPHKQGKYLPGTHIPIRSPECIFETQPDYVIVVAWNIFDEIIDQLQDIRDWGGEFVTFIPEVNIHELQPSLNMKESEIK